MITIIIIGIILFIIYAVSSKEKHTNIPSFKKFIVSNTADQGNQLNAKLMQENMTANLKILDNILIKYRALAKIIEVTYESKVCPNCNSRKMDFSNAGPTGQFITCQCSNCSKVQTFKLKAGKNGLKVIQLRDEIKHLIESFKRPVNEAFWKIEIDNSFMVNGEPDFISSKNNIVENLDTKVKSDSIIDISNIKAEYTVFIKEKPQRVVLYNFEGKVPYWENRDVFSRTEINDTDVFQRLFYNLFKTRFLNDDYIDLQGNFNYAFILYFDLMADYSKHGDIEKLEKQLLILAECYPSTKRFATKSLEDEFVLRGELKRAERLKNPG